MEPIESGNLISMGTLLKERVPIQKTKATERGELLRYFAGKLDKNIRYVAFRVTRFTIQDLYHLKSICDTYELEGNPWAKAFYGSLKVPSSISISSVA